MTCIVVSQQKTFMANRYMIKCSWSLIKRKIQFRDTMRHYCLLLGGWQTVLVRSSGKGNLAYCCWKYKLIQQLLKTVWKFLKNLNRTTKIYHCSVKTQQSPCSTSSHISKNHSHSHICYLICWSLKWNQLFVRCWMNAKTTMHSKDNSSA